MKLEIKAIWDGKVFIPLEPVNLKPGTKVKLTVTTLPKPKKTK